MILLHFNAPHGDQTYTMESGERLRLRIYRDNFMMLHWTLFPMTENEYQFEAGRFHNFQKDRRDNPVVIPIIMPSGLFHDRLKVLINWLAENADWWNMGFWFDETAAVLRMEIYSDDVSAALIELSK